MLKRIHIGFKFVPTFKKCLTEIRISSRTFRDGEIALYGQKVFAFGQIARYVECIAK